MKSKVGILTLHQITNYGGILQAYALQRVIKSFGYDVEVIEKSMYCDSPSAIKKVFLYSWRIFQKKVLRKSISIKKEEHQNERVTLWYESAKLTLPFVEKHIRHRYVNSFDEIHSDDYRTIVVGSDQIWRPVYVEDVYMEIEDAFLSFARKWNVNRISYAASFGSEEWEYTNEQTKKCKELLSLFKAVSCREDKGVEFCKQHLDYPNAVTVLDPTLLLTKQDYESLIGDNKESLKGDLMTYVLDKNKKSDDIINYVAQKESLTPFSVKAKTSYNSNNAAMEDKLQPPVEKWLQGFRDAKFIITDSFHACVFAIIFRKPFVVCLNSDRGIARYKTLLSKFNLEYRLVCEYNPQQIDAILKQPLKIDEVRLDDLRKESLNFLKSNL